MLYSPISVAACEPLDPEPWFNEIITAPIEADELSDILEINVLNKGIHLILINPTDIPLYVLRANYYIYDESNFQSSEFPSGFGAKLLLVSRKAYFWDMQGWTAIGYENQNNLIIRIISYNQLIGYEYTLLNLEAINVMKDDRPNDIEIPEPQYPYLSFSYDREFVQMKIEISYELNPKYIPNGVEIAMSVCDGFWEEFESTETIPTTNYIDDVKDEDFDRADNVGIKIGIGLTFLLGILYLLFRKQITVH